MCVCWSKTYPCPGSRAMARGCSMPPAISVVRISPFNLATSIWSRLLSIQYSFPVIQSTARPSGVARPCCTTTSIPATPEQQLTMFTQINVKEWLVYFFNAQESIQTGKVQKPCRKLFNIKRLLFYRVPLGTVERSPFYIYNPVVHSYSQMPVCLTKSLEYL